MEAPGGESIVSHLDYRFGVGRVGRRRHGVRLLMSLIEGEVEVKVTGKKPVGLLLRGRRDRILK